MTRYGELGLTAELDITRLGTNLVIFVADSGERFEVRVHEQNVRLLNIHMGRRWVSNARILSASASDVFQSAIQQMRRHEHSVLLTVISNECAFVPCRMNTIKLFELLKKS